MNEYKKDRPTSEQLVDFLDNELYITISSDVVHGLNFEYKQLQRENQELKAINTEYERLNRENSRGFKIINVQEYNIDELLNYKNNWNKLKKYIEQQIKEPLGGREFCCYSDVRDKMKKLEQGSEINE